MTRNRVIVSGLRPALQAAFEMRGASAGFRIDVANLEMGELRSEDETALVVIEAAGRGDGICAEVAWVRKHLRCCPIVVVSQGLTTQVVVNLVRMGVADVLDVPVELEGFVARVLDYAAEDDADGVNHHIVGSSAAMRNVRQQAETAARSGCTVLITGETGTGKGLFAKTIHELSTRRNKPFVHVNCAEFSSELIANELFGHEKGAFTGATTRQAGRFERALEGTIFLDEIGELDLGLQAKLLRVVEEREFERIGGGATLKVRARMIAATNVHMEDALRANMFRSDLYYRLKVFEVRLPALRDRMEDITSLANTLVDQISERLGVVAPREIENSFYARLRQYSWPGNVRELSNVLERILINGSAVRLAGDDLDGILPETSECERPEVLHRFPEEGHGVNCEDDAELKQVLQVLAQTGGNRARAARILGIGYGQLRYRLEKRGLWKVLGPQD